jgi:hypothetical protein
VFPRGMVYLRNISVYILHKGDAKDYYYYYYYYYYSSREIARGFSIV